MVNKDEIQKYLKGISYPVSKEGVVEHARSKQAPEQVISALERLSDNEFAGQHEIVKATIEM